MRKPSGDAQDRDHDRVAGAVDDTGEHVAPVAVATEDVVGVLERCDLLEAVEGLVGIVQRQQRGEEDGDQDDHQPDDRQPGGQADPLRLGDTSAAAIVGVGGGGSDELAHGRMPAARARSAAVTASAPG